MKAPYLKLAALVLAFVAGLGAGWKLWSPEHSAPSAPRPQAAAAIQQADHSVVLQVAPSAHPQPAQLVPDGAHVLETVHAVIHVDPIKPLPGATVPALPQDVRFDLTFVRTANGRRRVIVSSPDGRVVAGEYVPEDAPGPPAPRLLKNAAGLVWGTTAWGDKSVGAFYDRDFAFLRAGLELTRNTYVLANRQAWEVRGKIGVRF